MIPGERRESILTDKFLIRVKDIVLLVGAIAGLIVGLTKFYQMPFELQAAITRQEAELSRLMPMVDRHETQLAVIQAQYGAINVELQNINRKMNR